MTENIMFGSGYLYPGLYTPEQALALKERTFPKLWSFALDVCAAGGLGKLHMSEVSSHGKSAIIVNTFGMPVLQVIATERGDDVEYKIKNWHRHVKLRGKDRYTLVSTNRSYLLKQMAVHYAVLLDDVKSVYESQIRQGAKYFGAYLNDETNSAVKIDDIRLKPETAMDILRVMFEPGHTGLTLPTASLSKLQDVYTALKGKFAERQSYMDRIEDMFSQPKWILGVVPFDAPGFSLMVGAVSIKVKQLNEWGGTYELDFEHPLRLYRDLEHFYTTRPQDADSLKTALMFCKVNREKEGNTLKTYDKEGFLPMTNKEIYEDISGVAFGNCTPGSVMYPQWLMLGK